ncbi:MAG: single-stranded-DNA-specific exonuclease RecJ [Pirellulales bacterium]|nr:single-stranded-DNA-specific exonuclease RecJ [Pirellulales bacterium]
MQKRWRIRPHDPDRIAALQRATGVSAVVAQLLIARGIEEPTAAQIFLEPKLSALRDPQLLPGIPQAVEVIHAAITSRERIVIYGDYDVDGMTATALLWRCLKLLGADVGYYVPHRLDEGYGLNDEALTKLAAQGARLVITVDCGATAVAEAETARRLGLKLVITDHHLWADRLPEVDALVHPRLPGSSYPFGDLSGSGVAFKLAWALCQKASNATKVAPRMKDFLLQAIALASLGTVADVVPLVDENRVLVRHGLMSLSQHPTLGLTALIQVAELTKKSQLDAEDVAFSLAPRLNAAGRLGQAQLAVELLTTESEERALALAQYINELNNSRQSLERSIYLAANKQAQEEFDPHGDAALVLAGRGWHAGVIGIVASRLVEKYHRPVVLISLDQVSVAPGAGSARSVPGFDLHAALATCADHLLGFGGHAAAAGLKIEETRIELFRSQFCEHVAETIAAEHREPELWIDAEAPLSAFSLPVVTQIESLAPFGQGNRRPLLCANDVRLAAPPTKIGGGGRHLSLKLVQHGVAMRAVAFGGGEWAEEIEGTEGPLEIAFRPVINEFRGQRKVEIQLADWRVATGSVDGPAAVAVGSPASSSRQAG